MEDKKAFLKEERSQSWREELRKKIPNKEKIARERVEMPENDPHERNKSYIEVNKGLTEEQAIAEAERCLDCANPTCVEGCPVEINIPKFIKKIEMKEFQEAAKVLKDTNSLPAVCGRVCPQEAQCEGACFYSQKLNKDPIAIGHLERFAADYERYTGEVFVPEIGPSNNTRIGIVGSGPAGLTAAGDLAKMGYKVTLFEALHEIGGVLKYGIPEFRLPNNIVDQEIELLEKMGVEFVTNFIIGKTATFEDLKNEGYKAFFVGSGAGLPRFMNIPGENSVGIYSANEYLTRINLMKAANKDYDTPIISGKNVAVIGGGNTAMDAVRSAKRLGAERAMIFYRRSLEEMPAREEEIKHAQEEGIEFHNLNNPIAYYANERGHVEQMKVQKMELGEPDSSGRRRPVPIEGSEYMLNIDTAVVSIGVSPNPIIPNSLPELETTKWKTLQIKDDNMQCSLQELFAGGDIVRGGATVILAMGDGKTAAKGIDTYLKNNH